MINAEYLKFFGIGNVYELHNKGIDLEKIKEYCDAAEFNDRGKGIHTISLTSIDGSFDTVIDKGLKYIDNLNDASFRMPTKHFDLIAEYMPLLNDLKSVVGRTRIFRADPCGVWEPHRDGSSVIRIIVPIDNCNWENFRLIIDGQCMRLEHGTAYVINTLLEHCAVAFDSLAYILVITVLPTKETADIFVKNLKIK